MIRGATISEDGRYRYTLYRAWKPEKESDAVMFVMLNPSTADGTVDDPTIRRCIGFANRLGHGRLYVGNLFAYRATKPEELKAAEDPVGPENMKYLRLMAEDSTRIICAWGGSVPAKLSPLALGAAEMIAGYADQLYCLGKTSKGAPRHPLYLRNSVELEVFAG